MGCWNETCVITRTPIFAGDATVALTFASGATKYEHGNVESELFFGLPLFGNYDDYGSIEKPKNQKLYDFTNDRFSKNDYWKPLPSSDKLIASHTDTFWAHVESFKPFFFDYNSDNFSNIEDSSPESFAAYKKSEKALKLLGQNLKATEFNASKTENLKLIFKAIETSFETKNCWPIYNQLIKSGLYIAPSQLLMHESAYTTIVKEFGKRKVKTDSGFLNVQNVVERILNTAIELEKEDKEAWLWLSNSNKQKFNWIKPLSKLWTVNDLPINNHFWGTASIAEVLEVESMQSIVDFLVFQWAVHYMRISLKHPNNGSQSGETVLTKKVYNAVFSSLKKDNRIQTDFSSSFNF